MPPVQRAVPRVLINGAASPQLSRDLTSLRVHVVAGEASAELGLVSPLDVVRLKHADIESNQVEIHLPVDQEFFSGRLTATETRMPPDADQRTILFAVGAAPEGTSQPRVPLRFGIEVDSVSVRRQAHESTVHGKCNAVELRVNSRIDLTTNDPAFDGRFRVIELWYRFDAMSDAEVEFIARGDPSP